MAGSAVGVGFGHRGSNIGPGPHCNGTTSFDLQLGSNEPIRIVQSER